MFQIKHYNNGKTFQRVINNKIIKNDITFSKNINGGLGRLGLTLDVDYTNTDYNIGDIIEVYFGPSSSQILIYVGFIGEIENNLSNINEKTLNVFGLYSLFKNVLVDNSGYDFSITDDPADIIDLINGNVKTNFPFIENADTDTFGSNISLDFEYKDCFAGVSDVVDNTTDYYSYFDNYQLLFKEKPSTATYSFILGKDITSLIVEEDGTEITNDLIVERKSGTRTFADATSKTNYGFRQKYISKNDIGDTASADLFGNNYLDKNKNPKRKITMTLRNSFNDFFTINPGETCKIRNIKTDLGDNLQIVKITYGNNLTEAIIELEETENFTSLIKK